MLRTLRLERSRSASANSVLALNSILLSFNRPICLNKVLEATFPARNELVAGVPSETLLSKVVDSQVLGSKLGQTPRRLRRNQNSDSQINTTDPNWTKLKGAHRMP